MWRTSAWMWRGLTPGPLLSLFVFLILSVLFLFFLSLIFPPAASLYFWNQVNLKGPLPCLFCCLSGPLSASAWDQMLRLAERQSAKGLNVCLHLPERMQKRACLYFGDLLITLIDHSSPFSWSASSANINIDLTHIRPGRTCSTAHAAPWTRKMRGPERWWWRGEADHSNAENRKCRNHWLLQTGSCTPSYHRDWDSIGWKTAVGRYGNHKGWFT